MTYEKAIEYIHGTQKFGSKLGLDNIKKLLDLMGNPQDMCQYVHIAGTNGKGSTAAYINSIMIQSGIKVGLFTSPYLERFEERIRINNICISPGQLAEITCYVRQRAERMLTEGHNQPTAFEIVTAIAFEYFHRNKCDLVVLEVGLGGRLDATNVIKPPLVSVITPISFDHIKILGGTLAAIAYEKSGIIKKGSKVVIHPQPTQAENVIRNICIKKDVELVKTRIDSVKVHTYDINKTEFRFLDYGLQTSIIGKHQVFNAAVAITAVHVLAQKGFRVNEKDIIEGTARAKWPGRMEVIRKSPLFLIDGAHNDAGTKVLAESIGIYFKKSKVIFIFGVMKDKDYISMIRHVSPYAEAFVAVTPPVKRALPAKKLGIILKDYCKRVLVSDTIEEAIRTSFSMSGQHSIICAFGSLYFIGEVRKYFSHGKDA